MIVRDRLPGLPRVGRPAAADRFGVHLGQHLVAWIKQLDEYLVATLRRAERAPVQLKLSDFTGRGR